MLPESYGIGDGLKSLIHIGGGLTLGTIDAGDLLIIFLIGSILLAVALIAVLKFPVWGVRQCKKV